MNDQQMHDHIIENILGEQFDIIDFDNFTAKISSSTHPLFQNDEDFCIEFYFEEESDLLLWKAYDYEAEDEDKVHGVEFNWGTIVNNVLNH